MKNLLIGLVMVFIVVSSYAQTANEAFAELDQTVAKEEATAQVQFRLLVVQELESFKKDLVQAGKDSAYVAKATALVERYADKLTSSDLADNPAKMTESLQVYMGQARKSTGLVSSASSDAAGESTRVPGGGTWTAEDQARAQADKSVPTAAVSGNDIAAARLAANWVKNLEEIPGDWSKRGGQIWQSTDGLVTFVVGKGPTRTIAEMAGRLVLTNKHGRWEKVTVASVDGPVEYNVMSADVIGASAVQYAPAKNGMVYCLIGIPTSLLPK